MMESKQTGIYRCPECGRQWPWYREPITEFPLVCPDCSIKQPEIRVEFVRLKKDTK